MNTIERRKDAVKVMSRLDPAQRMTYNFKMKVATLKLFIH